MRDPSTELDWHRPADFDDETQAKKRKATRQITIVVAFVVFQLTVGLAVGLAVAVVSFGIRDVRTALLLRKVDPNRVRGRVCSWFYLAHACWCVFLADLPFVLMIGYYENLYPNQPRSSHPFADEIIIVAVVFLCAFVIGTLASCIGVGSAIKHGIRVWVDPRFRLSPCANGWPPRRTSGWLPILSGLSNQADHVSQTVTVTVCLLIVIGVAVLGLFLTFWLQGEPFGIVGFSVCTLVLIAWTMLVWLALSPSWRARMKHVVASTPRECYPELRS